MQQRLRHLLPEPLIKASDAVPHTLSYLLHRASIPPFGYPIKDQYASFK